MEPALLKTLLLSSAQRLQETVCISFRSQQPSGLLLTWPLTSSLSSSALSLSGGVIPDPTWAVHLQIQFGFTIPLCPTVSRQKSFSSHQVWLCQWLCCRKDTLFGPSPTPALTIKKPGRAAFMTYPQYTPASGLFRKMLESANMSFLTLLNE